jgi:hypothetical protein
LTVATLVGEAAVAVAAEFTRLRAAPDPAAVGGLCQAIRDHGLSLPVVYFAEWVDRWLMGDLVPGPEAVAGGCFEATCLTAAEATDWADGCGSQFREQEWFASRLREAAGVWGPTAARYAVVVIREVVDASTTDDQVHATMDHIPEWLSVAGIAVEPRSAPDTSRGS